jgi:hypothetical protein
MGMGWQTAVVSAVGCLISFGLASGFIRYVIEAVISGQIAIIGTPVLILISLGSILLGWFGGLRMLWLIAYAFGGSSYLEIDSSSFRLGWKCLCFGAQVQGKTANIVRIERWSNHTLTIREKIGWDELAAEVTPVEKERLLPKVHKHELAGEVTTVEQDWLVAEVSDFLKHLSTQKS